MSIVREYISHYELPVPYVDFLSLHLVEEFEETVSKFKKGHEEHGGNLFARDLNIEALAEVRDLGVYIKADKYKHLFAEAMDKWIQKQKNLASTPKLL